MTSLGADVTQPHEPADNSWPPTPAWPTVEWDQPSWAATPPPAAPRYKRTRAIAIAAAAAVVVAGAGVSYVAVHNQNSGGSASPQGAVRGIVGDLTKSDLLGVLDDLPPAERSSVRDSFLTEVTQLKRLKVLSPAADPGQVAGVGFSATGLTFDPNDVVINSRVRIVTLTGGTIRVNADASKIPYTKEFLDAAFDGHSPTSTSTDTYDLARSGSSGGSPARIAVQEVGGKWYPSFLYTAMDAYAHDEGLAAPGPGDAIAAQGGSSAEDAVRRLITAASTSDARAAIALLDPDEGAAFHDYGALLVRNSSRSTSGGFEVENVAFSTTDVAGGVRVSLKSLSFDIDGVEQSYTVDNGCVVTVTAGKSERFCAADAIKLFAGSLELTAAEQAAVGDLIAALPKIGIVTTESGGKWYISPTRTYADLGTAVLSNLKTDDLLTLIRLARRQ